jgi:hypothetical protein
MAIVEIEKFSNHSSCSEMHDLRDAILRAIDDLEILIREVQEVDEMITYENTFFDQADVGGTGDDWSLIMDEIRDRLASMEIMDYSISSSAT